MIERDSVFLRALGDEARLLRPEVLEYIAGPPETYHAGFGRGVFEVAGSPYRRLAGLLRALSGPAVVLSAYERDVPFEIINRPTSTGNRLELKAERRFEFRRGEQRFADILRVGFVSGTLVNTLGSDGRIELLLDCAVTPDGDFQLTSRAARIRVGSRKFRLPKLFGVNVQVVDGWDVENVRHTISVLVRNPVVGTVLRYRGWFTYEYVR